MLSVWHRIWAQVMIMANSGNYFAEGEHQQGSHLELPMYDTRPPFS